MNLYERLKILRLIHYSNDKKTILKFESNGSVLCKYILLNSFENVLNKIEKLYSNFHK